MRLRRALESDLIRAGLRLRWFDEGHPDFTLGDLVAFVAGLPRTAALSVAQGDEFAEWGPAEDLLALVVDNLALLRSGLAGVKEMPPLVSRGANQASEVSRAGSGMPEGPQASKDLNDDYQGGQIVGLVQSTEDIARELGWT